MTKVCVVGASGKLGQYMVQHALDRGYEVVGVCRERSVHKLDAFKGLITLIPGATNDREVIQRAVAAKLAFCCKLKVPVAALVMSNREPLVSDSVAPAVPATDVPALTVPLTGFGAKIAALATDMAVLPSAPPLPSFSVPAVMVVVPV